MSTATVFEYCLNFREDHHESYWYIEDVLNLFETRAKEMRDAIPGSPRWKLGKDTSVDEQVPFRSPFVYLSVANRNCVMFERFTKEELKKDIIPKNLFASRRLGRDFYGIVLVFRMISFGKDVRRSCLDNDFDWDKQAEKELKEDLENQAMIKKYSFVMAANSSISVTS